MEDEFGLTNEDWMSLAQITATCSYELFCALSTENSVLETDT